MPMAIKVRMGEKAICLHINAGGGVTDLFGRLKNWVLSVKDEDLGKITQAVTEEVKTESLKM